MQASKCHGAILWRANELFEAIASLETAADVRELMKLAV